MKQTLVKIQIPFKEPFIPSTLTEVDFVLLTFCSVLHLVWI